MSVRVRHHANIYLILYISDDGTDGSTGGTKSPDQNLSQNLFNYADAISRGLPPPASTAITVRPSTSISRTILAVPSFTKRMKCSRCGGRQVHVIPAWSVAKERILTAAISDALLKNFT